MNGISTYEFHSRGTLKSPLCHRYLFLCDHSKYSCISAFVDKYTMMYQSNTTKLYDVYYCIRAARFDSYRIIVRPF